MNMNENRRKVIKNLIAGSVAMGSSSILTACATDNKKDTMDIKLKGNINHSVCQWCCRPGCRCRFQHLSEGCYIACDPCGCFHSYLFVTQKILFTA